jgi:hypothetical protein
MAEQLEQQVDNLKIAEPNPETVVDEKTADTPAPNQVRNCTIYIYICDIRTNRVLIGR